MAEAFAKIQSPPRPSRREGEDEIQFFSAGSKPSGKINEKAIQAMKEIGYDLTKHKSKSLDEILNSIPFGDGGVGLFDYVITMGCGDECPFIPAKHREDWQIPEPKHLPMDAFRKIRDEIGEKVKKLMENV